MSRRRRSLRLDLPHAAAIGAGVVALWLLCFVAGWLVAFAPERRAAAERRYAAAEPATRDPATRRAAVPAPRAAVAAPSGSSVTPRMKVYSFTPIDLSLAPRPPRGRAAYAPLIAEASVRRALPKELVTAIIRVESDFDPRVVSHKGALGLMQLMPATAARFGVDRHELFDPGRNIDAGTAYLAWLLDRYDGDLDRTLAAYNAGEGAVDKYGGIPPYRETQQYVRRVRAALPPAMEN